MDTRSAKEFAVAAEGEGIGFVVALHHELLEDLGDEECSENATSLDETMALDADLLALERSGFGENDHLEDF